ncbi:MAG: hypothetical protein Q7S40_30930 [Opitutaceae bacterium]|nr:hypothetical protein [Opitutaceae bacterium]
MNRQCLVLAVFLATAGCSAPHTAPRPTAPTAPSATDAAARARRAPDQPGDRALAAVDALVLHDTKRGKDLPVRLTYPEGKDRRPLIVWSHGAGRSKDKYLVWVDGLDHGYGGATGAEWFNPRNKPNADHIAWTRAVTTAFWQVYLEKDDAALAWLRADRLAALSRSAATVEHK